MGRAVRFGDTALTLYMTGLTRIFALKRKVVIPYRTIRSVYVDFFDAPRWMLRMPGTSIPGLPIYEGSFKYANEWYFLSYEHRIPLVNLELAGHGKYDYVIFEIDKPETVAAEIRKRLRNGRSMI